MQPDPVRILIVDDVPQNLDALEALLATDGLELVRACSGPEALELLLVHDFALALLDVQMPGMNGFELAELMRGTEMTRGVPIIFLTAVATDELRRFHGYEAGAVDYLLKPIDAAIVRSKVAVFVELARQRQQIARHRDELAFALHRIEAHRDNSPLAFVEIDADRKVIGWSAGAERLFGRAAQSVVGLPLGRINWIENDGEGSAFDALMARMSAGEQAREMLPLRFRTASGAMLDCECYCSALLDTFGRLLSVDIQILDVSDRKRAEETQRLLIGELNHRVKNTLASVQAIATQTLRHSSGAMDFAPTFIGRIHSLSKAHSLLSSTTWQGASLQQLIEDQLKIGTVASDRLHVSGPPVDLAPEPALHLALVIHELITNATKYGALSTAEGTVRLEWEHRDGELTIDWAEHGGPPVKRPKRAGFGTTLIERTLSAEGGTSRLDYAPAGLTCALTLPLATAERRSVRRRVTTEDKRARRPKADPADMLLNKRILVIEDEPLVALELASILGDAGARVSGPVASSADALAALAEDAIDAAILDGNLQGEKVDEVAKALVARAVPFVFVTGYGRESLPQGFDAVPIISKPFDADVIIAALSALIGEAAELSGS